MRLRQIADALQLSNVELQELFFLADVLPPKVEQRVQQFPVFWNFDPERILNTLQKTLAILIQDATYPALAKELQQALEPVPW